MITLSSSIYFLWTLFGCTLPGVHLYGCTLCGHFLWKKATLPAPGTTLIGPSERRTHRGVRGLVPKKTRSRKNDLQGRIFPLLIKETVTLVIYTADGLGF